jgi:hypothetical protein
MAEKTRVVIVEVDGEEYEVEVEEASEAAAE